MSSDFAIHASDVVKEYDAGAIRALNGANLTVERGEFVAVTGPSGCGKSTLLHLLAALDSPTSGTIIVDGRKLGEMDMDRYRREEVGLVFQLHNLLPHLDALQNIEVAMFSNGAGYATQRGIARALLSDVGLEAKERMTPPRLSGGERQRLAIARALANRPPIILADEPTGNLDSASVDAVLALLRRLREERNVTIVMVTHDAHVAGAADRTVHMVDGRTEPENTASLAIPMPVA